LYSEDGEITWFGQMEVEAATAIARIIDDVRQEQSIRLKGQASDE
jgi:hypothetical protein